jgi:hypothetical protein
MLAAEHSKGLGFQALHAKGGSVDPGLAEFPQFGRFDAGGVGFQGDFDVGFRVEQAEGVLQQSGNSLGLH